MGAPPEFTGIRLSVSAWRRTPASAALTALGAVLRLGGDSFAWAMVGQVVAGIAQPLVLNAVAKIATGTLRAPDRAAGITIGSAGLVIGQMVGLLLGPILGSAETLTTLLVVEAVVACGGRRRVAAGRRRDHRRDPGTGDPARSWLLVQAVDSAPMRTRIRRTAMTVVAGCVVLGSTVAAASASAASSPEPGVAIQQLNDWRRSVGVEPVIEDPQQTENCRAHAAYYGQNPGARGHSEDPSKPGYSEAGDRGASSSVLSYGGVGPLTWADAIYHRTSLLNPRLTASGYWSENGISCMGVFSTGRGPVPELRVYAYPYDGQTNVDTTFYCNETPNPCDAFGSKTPIGFIPSVQFDGPHAGTPTVDRATVTASMTPDGGAAPIATIVDPRSGTGSPDGGVAVLPNTPLADGTWYTVRVSGTVDGEVSSASPVPDMPFSATWRFKTAESFEAGDSQPSPEAGTAAGTAARRRVQSVKVTITRKRLSLRFGALRGRSARYGTVRFMTASGRRVSQKRVKASGLRTMKVPARAKRTRISLPQTKEWKSRTITRRLK